MGKPEISLFEAFRADHAVLGQGFYELGERLRAADAAGARQLAARIDHDAGPHIAFEEADFYPALKPILGRTELDEMYLDHARGRALLEEILALDATQIDDARQKRLLAGVEAMQTHIADCGDLFGAMGSLAPEQQNGLLKRLLFWREQAPRWLKPAAQGGSHDPGG